MFEWDEQKNTANLINGISFDEAKLIFEGRVLSWADTRNDYGELREISIGLIRNVVAATVVHTDRDGITRIISARLASRSERNRYFEHIRQAAEGTGDAG